MYYREDSKRSCRRASSPARSLVHRRRNVVLDLFYYITTLNENYPHPAMLEGAEEGIPKGALLREVKADQPGLNVRLFDAGAILREAEAAAEMLASEHGVSSEVWSVKQALPSCAAKGSMSSAGIYCDPEADPEDPIHYPCFVGRQGASHRATDYIKALADGISPHVPARYKALGTDARTLRLSPPTALIL